MKRKPPFYNKMDKGSSLKNNKFIDKSNKDELIQKYENLLTSRENQIKDLSIEIGSLNESYASVMQKMKMYEEENKKLKKQLETKESILKQELANKEIMFIKLDNTENECDRLKREVSIVYIQLESIRKGDYKKERNTVSESLTPKVSNSESMFKKNNMVINTSSVNNDSNNEDTSPKKSNTYTPKSLVRIILLRIH